MYSMSPWKGVTSQFLSPLDFLDTDGQSRSALFLHSQPENRFLDFFLNLSFSQRSRSVRLIRREWWYQLVGPSVASPQENPTLSLNFAHIVFEEVICC